MKMSKRDFIKLSAIQTKIKRGLDFVAKEDVRLCRVGKLPIGVNPSGDEFTAGLYPGLSLREINKEIGSEYTLALTGYAELVNFLRGLIL